MNGHSASPEKIVGEIMLLSTNAQNKEDFMKEVGEDFKVFSMTAASIDINNAMDDESILVEVENGQGDVGERENSQLKQDGNNTKGENMNGNYNENNAESSALDTNARYVAPKDFELLKVIGLGAFGKVLQVKNKKTQEVYAMKVISKRLLRKKVSYVQNVQAERDILTKIRHPFIVPMRCSFQTKQKLFIIMDFCAGGELFLRLGREGVFLERTAAFYLAEIILALDHLHSKGILHRDLKPENILLNLDGHLALTDFGLAKDFSSDTFDDDSSLLEQSRVKTICGTGEYMAPEMIARKGYGKPADFWSLGCIAYEMMSGNPPFESRKGTKDLFRKILNERVRMPDGLSPPAHRLLKGLLNRDASKRLGSSKGTMFVVGGITELKLADFFSGLDWRLLELKEIDPPESLISSSGGDLEHFHDEFLNMNLPRSVKEMSKSDFKAQRCASNTFKGFSFIQDDFVLPERQDNDIEHYWNNVDGDEYSVSTNASSKHDDEDVPPVSEKKKRPPRKKKKKKNVENQAVLNPLETCHEIDQNDKANQSNATESERHTSIAPSIELISITNETLSKTSNKASLLSKEKNDNVKPKKELANVSTKPKLQQRQQPKEPVWEEVKKKTAVPPLKTVQTHTSRYSLSNKPFAPSSRPESMKLKIAPRTVPAQKQPYIQLPGTWAARAVTAKKTTATTSLHSRQHTTNPSRGVNSLPQDSSSLTRSQPLPTSTSSMVTPSTITPLERKPAIAVQEAFWPSLGDNKSKSTTGPVTKTGTSVSGSWTKRPTAWK